MDHYTMFFHAAPGSEGKNQDAAYGCADKGVHALAIGDGVTQAGQYAGIGARMAVIMATRFLIEKFDEIAEVSEDQLRNVFYTYVYEYYSKSLDKYARQNGMPPVFRENTDYYHPDFLRKCPYSTTLVACAVKDDILITMKVGNGIIAVDTGNGFGVVSPSSIPGVATPSLEVLVNPAFKHFSFKRYQVKDLRGIVLMSDGPEVSNPRLFQKDQKHMEPAFVDWLKEATVSEKAFADKVTDLGLCGPDDISVALLWQVDVEPRLITDDRNPLEEFSLYGRRSISDVIIVPEKAVEGNDEIDDTQGAENECQTNNAVQENAQQLFFENYWQSILNDDPVMKQAILRYNQDFPWKMTVDQEIRKELFERIFGFCRYLAHVEVKERRKLKKKEHVVYTKIRTLYCEYIESKQDRTLKNLRNCLAQAENLDRRIMFDNHNNTGVRVMPGKVITAVRRHSP